MRAAQSVACLLMLAACAHEFVWQAWPDDQQGDVRMVMQWPLIAALCLCVAVLARDRLVSAACAAVSLMSITTAACSLAWLVSPWPVLPGSDQCSERLGVPMLLVSGIAACIVLSLWRAPKNGTESG